MSRGPYKRRGGSARTPERLETFVAMWSRADVPPEYDDVLAALNAIGGPPYLTRGNLMVWRSELKLRSPRPGGRRGHGHRVRAAKVAPAPQADPLPVTPSATAEPRKADGFVGATDHATREVRQPAPVMDIEPMPWSAVENYAALNGIPTTGPETMILAKVNALRESHRLPRWTVVPDRRAVREAPFPPLVAPRNGRDDAYIARAAS